MRLSAGGEMNTCEPPNDRVIKVRDVYLGEMKVDLLRPVSSRHTASVDDRQA